MTPSDHIGTSSELHRGNRLVGAVVVGGDYQGLGIVRSLGQRGIPVCVIDDEHSISRYSRYCSRFVKLPDLSDETKAVECILRIGRDLDLYGWVLYPTRDEHVAAFANHRPDLSAVFRVPTPPWRTVQFACDKRNTYAMAQGLHIPTPITRYPVGCTLAEAVEGLLPPYAIKPAVKEPFLGLTKEKAWWAADYPQLRRLVEKAVRLIEPGEVMIQELIPGGGTQQYSYCAFFSKGRAVGKMVARRLRQHPLRFGRASTYVETVENRIVEELSERFLRAIDYYGLVEIEYKLDPRDHQFKLLDVNARTWGYHSIGGRAGVDFSYLLYCDQLGVSVPPCRGDAGVSWVRVLTDLPAGFVGVIAGEIGMAAYIRTLRRCNVEAVFSRKDPFPGLAEIVLLPYQIMKRGF